MGTKEWLSFLCPNSLVGVWVHGPDARPFLEVEAINMKSTVLILCTGNSCRSHIAEGFLHAAAGDLVNVQSAGSSPTGCVHPLAIKVMAEVGIDISGHRSKHLKEFLGQPIRTVVTVCGNLDQGCPVFPGQMQRHHWPFLDPAKATGGEVEILNVFRQTRDEMRRVFEAYAAGLKDAVM
jgi:arsenate reductase (thioredoxin)